MENSTYKILLVEDDQVDQAAFKRHVQKERLLYNHSIAGSLSEAKKILSSETFDAAIIDYNLGDGTAFDLIDLVVGTPFIIVTGAGDEAVAVKAMKTGAYDYLIKDVGRNYLQLLPIVIEMAIVNKRRENQLKLLSMAVMSIQDSVYFTDMENKILFINNSFLITYGYREEDIIGLPSDILCEKYPSGRDLSNTLSEATKDIWCGEMQHVHKNGTKFPIYISKAIVKDELEKELGIVSIVRDISELKATEQRLEYMAHFDDLTKLSNRVLFYDRLNKMLSRANRDNLLFALLVLDLDRFKIVNDTLGHNTGDILLRMTAERLLKCVRDSDTVSRLGGDEFAIILAGIKKEQNAATVAQKIIDCLENPFIINDEPVTIGTSIGITIHPSDGNSPDSLVKNADMAMYKAKRGGRNRYEFYNSEMNAASITHFAVENKLREAIKNEEFLLYYQPQVDIHTETIVGTEALIRWQHPQQGLVLPNDFMPIAEETGLIIPIGEWVLRTACMQNKLWQNSGYQHIPVSVNVSPRQFRQDGFAEKVAQVLNETGLDTLSIEIELTESILMYDEELVMARLELLTARGVRLSIDDFGTRYSSMKYLKRLPIHTLKIDMSFVADITTNPNDKAICEAIITMAHSLNLKVVAEGIETREQLDVLRSIGCDIVQGFWFHKPISAEKITDLLSQGK